ncbi:hypothetical protein [Bacillus altitudinis]|uniref:hypothetical protein n=1 Tax=Bacillus altitudinis TaxID=293387 RepID=UPI0011A0958F|nr:hypothetical protein [Bacillus altitudinis]
MKLIGGGVIGRGAYFIGENGLVKLMMFLGGYLVVGGDVVVKGVKNIVGGEVFDEKLLMRIGRVGGFVIEEYGEGLGVMVF